MPCISPSKRIMQNSSSTIQLKHSIDFGLTKVKWFGCDAAAASTFARFFPGIKARYDYGVVIFILTFSLVAVSGYRVDELIKLAHQRLSTIILGSCTCLFISVCVCPVWAGEDLQKLIGNNIEKIAMFLEGKRKHSLNKPSFNYFTIFFFFSWLVVHSHLILEKITGFGEEYLKKEEGESDDVVKKDRSFLEAYKSILNSKSSEESLVRNLWFC